MPMTAALAGVYTLCAIRTLGLHSSSDECYTDMILATPMLL